MANGNSFIGAALVGLGVALGGWFVGHGFVSARAGDRYVTVKGVSEREVQADLALWPLRVVATDDDLTRAQARVAQQIAQIRGFLVKQGVDTAAAELQNLEVTDVRANPYRDAPVTSRYIVAQTLMVRSNAPGKVAAASQHVGDLVEAGVVLSSDGGMNANGPTFLFTRLNDFKPAMIAEATAAAREAAAKFAADSRSRLGGIRQANQGVFVILPRDQAPGIQEESQLNKVMRVVSTVDYYLRD